jgi:hypothetical protein
MRGGIVFFFGGGFCAHWMSVARAVASLNLLFPERLAAKTANVPVAGIFSFARQKLLTCIFIRAVIVFGAVVVVFHKPYLTAAFWTLFVSHIPSDCGFISTFFSPLAGGNTGYFAFHAFTVLPVTLQRRRPDLVLSSRSSRQRGVIVLIGTFSAAAISAFV